MCSPTPWNFGDILEGYFLLVYPFHEYMVLSRDPLLRLSSLTFFVSSQDLRFWTGYDVWVVQWQLLFPLNGYIDAVGIICGPLGARYVFLHEMICGMPLLPRG